ncbi:MAG: DUF3820 family protein [Phaeodactylibacter sp.]|nr:DUF3820 family protein [Phaeodactylibacter sp.]
MSDVNKLEDHSPMPYGKYQGKAMEDVPAGYLIWLYDNARASPAVARYVKDNMDVLQKEIKEGGSK